MSVCVFALTYSYLVFLLSVCTCDLNVQICTHTYRALDLRREREAASGCAQNSLSINDSAQDILRSASPGSRPKSKSTGTRQTESAPVCHYTETPPTPSVPTHPQLEPVTFEWPVRRDTPHKHGCAAAEAAGGRKEGEAERSMGEGDVRSRGVVMEMTGAREWGLLHSGVALGLGGRMTEAGRAAAALAAKAALAVLSPSAHSQSKISADAKPSVPATAAAVSSAASAAPVAAPAASVLEETLTGQILQKSSEPPESDRYVEQVRQASAPLWASALDVDLLQDCHNDDQSYNHLADVDDEREDPTMCTMAPASHTQGQGRSESGTHCHAEEHLRGNVQSSETALSETTLAALASLNSEIAAGVGAKAGRRHSVAHAHAQVVSDTMDTWRSLYGWYNDWR